MRYFRYNHTCKNLNNSLTDQYNSLIRCEKRILQKEKNGEDSARFFHLSSLLLPSLRAFFCLNQFRSQMVGSGISLLVSGR